MGGDHDDLGRSAVVLDCLQHLEARQPRHQHVGHHQVAWIGAEHLDRLLAVLGGRHAVPDIGEGGDQELADRGLVVHDQDPARGLRAALRRARGAGVGRGRSGAGGKRGRGRPRRRRRPGRLRGLRPRRRLGEGVEIGPGDGSPVEQAAGVQIHQTALDDAPVLVHPEAGDPLDRVHRLGVAAEVVQDPLGDVGTRGPARDPLPRRTFRLALHLRHAWTSRPPHCEGRAAPGTLGPDRGDRVFSTSCAGAGRERDGSVSGSVRGGEGDLPQGIPTARAPLYRRAEGAKQEPMPAGKATGSQGDDGSTRHLPANGLLAGDRVGSGPDGRDPRRGAGKRGESPTPCRRGGWWASSDG